MSDPRRLHVYTWTDGTLFNDVDSVVTSPSDVGLCGVFTRDGNLNWSASTIHCITGSADGYLTKVNRGKVGHFTQMIVNHFILLNCQM